MAFVQTPRLFLSAARDAGCLCGRSSTSARHLQSSRMMMTEDLGKAEGESLSDEEILKEAKWLAKTEGSDGERKALLYARQISPRKGLELLLYLLDSCENEIVEATATVMLAQLARKDASLLEECVQVLSERLSSINYDYGIRSAAATGLGELQHAGSFEALRRSFYEDTEWAVQYAIIAALGNLGESKAVPLLVDALESPTEMIVQRAISSLGELKDPAAVPHLLGMVGKVDMVVEQSLAQALGSFVNDPDVMSVLRMMANSDNPLTCFAAEEALQNVEEQTEELQQSSNPNLTLRDMLERSFNQAYSNRSRESQVPADKEAAAEFGRMSIARQAEYEELCSQLKVASADERTIAAIRLRSFPKRLKEAAVTQADTLQDSSQRVRASALNLVAHNPNTLASVLLGDPDQNVRSSACSALVECGEVEAGVVATITAFENDRDWIVRVSAAIALGTYAVNDNRAYEVLVSSLCLVDGVPYIAKLQAPEALVVQTHAIASLGFVGNKDVLPVFREMLPSVEPKIRKSLASALGFISDAMSLVLLGGLAEDDDDEVREAARKSRSRLLADGF